MNSVGKGKGAPVLSTRVVLGDVGGPEIDVLHLTGKIFVDAVSQANTPGQLAVVHSDLIRLGVKNAERIAEVGAGTLRILIAHSQRRGHVEARLGGAGTGCKEAQATAETLKLHDLQFIVVLPWLPKVDLPRLQES